MTANNAYSFPLPNGSLVSINQKNNQWFLSHGIETQAIFKNADNGQKITFIEYTGTLFQTIWLTAYWFISRNEDIPGFAINPAKLSELTPELTQCLQQGLLIETETENLYQCDKGLFWQQAKPWLPYPASIYPLQMQMTNGKYHPRRPADPTGEVYKRFIPELSIYFSLHTATIEEHLPYLHQWMNNPRVDYFWEESGDLEKHNKYLRTIINDKHTQPLIGCFDGQPFAYFEAYWAKEDRIAPFYDAGNYDRGIHMLVGDDNHRGPHKVKAWLSSLVHYLFLDEPRTQMVVSEPRYDNDKMIHYQQQTGFFKQKEFNFPHKRAAMMSLHRETFFDNCLLSH
jgi:acetyl CoA:N6-hydroxylysine acetyl transferase